MQRYKFLKNQKLPPDFNICKQIKRKYEVTAVYSERFKVQEKKAVCKRLIFKGHFRAFLR